VDRDPNALLRSERAAGHGERVAGWPGVSLRSDVKHGGETVAVLRWVGALQNVQIADVGWVDLGPEHAVEVGRQLDAVNVIVESVVVAVYVNLAVGSKDCSGELRQDARQRTSRRRVGQQA